MLNDSISTGLFSPPPGVPKQHQECIAVTQGFRTLLTPFVKRWNRRPSNWKSCGHSGTITSHKVSFVLRTLEYEHKRSSARLASYLRKMIHLETCSLFSEYASTRTWSSAAFVLRPRKPTRSTSKTVRGRSPPFAQRNVSSSRNAPRF